MTRPSEVDEPAVQHVALQPAAEFGVERRTAALDLGHHEHTPVECRIDRSDRLLGSVGGVGTIITVGTIRIVYPVRARSRAL